MSKTEKTLATILAQLSLRRAKEAIALGEYRSAVLLSRLASSTRPEDPSATALLKTAERKLKSFSRLVHVRSEDEIIEELYAKHRRKIEQRFAAAQPFKPSLAIKRLFLQLSGYLPKRRKRKKKRKS